MISIVHCSRSGRAYLPELGSSATVDRRSQQSFDFSHCDLVMVGRKVYETPDGSRAYFEARPLKTAEDLLAALLVEPRELVTSDCHTEVLPTSRGYSYHEQVRRLVIEAYCLYWRRLSGRGEAMPAAIVAALSLVSPREVPNFATMVAEFEALVEEIRQCPPSVEIGASPPESLRCREKEFFHYDEAFGVDGRWSADNFDGEAFGIDIRGGGSFHVDSENEALLEQYRHEVEEFEGRWADWQARIAAREAHIAPQRERLTSCAFCAWLVNQGEAYLDWKQAGIPWLGGALIGYDRP